MEVIKFTISGKTAFFKDPSVNSGTTLTFNCIHKISIMGIIGAIMGYEGYNTTSLKQNLVNKPKNKKNKLVIPEFYSKLKDSKISIVENKVPSKSVQYYTCTSGTANEKDGKQGLTSIITEQWLENVSWDIYFTIEDLDLLNEIYEKLCNFEWRYIPFLGNNSHFCNITNISKFEIAKTVIQNESVQSLFIMPNDFEFDESEDENFSHYRQFRLPISFNEDYWFYKTEIFCSSDYKIKSLENVYKTNDTILQFY